jgi:hydroxyacylglutathione hydrolase
MSQLEFYQFICRSDNYGVLIHDTSTGQTASIDAPDGAEIGRQLKKRGWRLTHILTTHHHGDHVEGNTALRAEYGCEIIGPASEADRIPDMTRSVSGGDSFNWAGHDVHVLACPGHTKGHIAYHIPSAQVILAGDTLFSLGCGRVFEGSMNEMFGAVSQFASLPPETRLYCGHEYTQSNARFALSVEPGNENLRQRAAEVDQLRASGRMTCPTTIGLELRTNPFLRTGSAEIRQILGLAQAADVEVFTELRRRKDVFR